ncbi:MAG TPA: hypothetical protein PK355_06540 [Chitinophagales bacterium]|nr:hypothetical protein [Chitinophagales bacterium]
MRIKLLILIIISFLFTEIPTANARPRRPKSCVKKVLLPGHSKPVKCSKARKMKNNYF